MPEFDRTGLGKGGLRRGLTWTLPVSWFVTCDRRQSLRNDLEVTANRQIACALRRDKLPWRDRPLRRAKLSTHQAFRWRRPVVLPLLHLRAAICRHNLRTDRLTARREALVDLPRHCAAGLALPSGGRHADPGDRARVAGDIRGAAVPPAQRKRSVRTDPRTHGTDCMLW